LIYKFYAIFGLMRRPGFSNSQERYKKGRGSVSSRSPFLFLNPGHRLFPRWRDGWKLASGFHMGSPCPSASDFFDFYASL